ncbi:ABC transporter permease [Rhodanobacter sp. DHB23]|uniref:ABC transporter permease n=1 Tax=Rhodanobacter sp. DHB23 TaxID=2775923 RepID=UPI0017847B14|nr:ABC transporter permease [Rhodanobacter sp. DHB23]MBD8872200.1 ABC transporter permease [Rhodanobacter sp. DHB23]
MWRYYVALALRSSARSKALTALVIALLAFGVSACMVSYAVFRATTSDPLPGKSSRLYAVQIDNVGPSYTWHGEPPDMLSYTDAVALWQAHKADRQTLLYPASWQVESDDPTIPAMPMSGDAVTADFFPMFDVPFRFGASWSANEDAQHANVVVISRRLNEKLFGGQNSVGHEIRLDGKAFRVAGVLDDWNPRPRFFDIGELSRDQAFDNVGDIYIPFTRATDMQKNSRYANCPTATGETDTSNWGAYLHGECGRIGAWVGLATPADAERYREYLRNYAKEQQRLGRFAWPPNVRLNSLMDWLAYLNIAPKASSFSMLISGSFLLIVMVNVVGLMLARFMRRAPEIGIRRALGASRADIYQQFLIEGAAIGFTGGLLGLALTLLGLWGIGRLFEPKIARLVHVDAPLVLLTLLLAVIATVVSALYPTWRAAQTRPAWQIKINH